MNSQQSAIVPFGKYKDELVELLLADDEYLNWVLAEPGLAPEQKAV
jgi:uncharacterized protein (DUF3820 family)